MHLSHERICIPALPNNAVITILGLMIHKDASLLFAHPKNKTHRCLARLTTTIMVLETKPCSSILRQSTRWLTAIRPLCVGKALESQAKTVEPIFP
jgi:hypothetical protein